MGIAEFIARQKAAIREKKDVNFLSNVDKLERLQSERIDLEKRQHVADQVRKEKKAVRDLKLQPIKSKLAGIKSITKNIKKNLNQNQAKQTVENPWKSAPAANPFKGETATPKKKKQNNIF